MNSIFIKSIYVYIVQIIDSKTINNKTERLVSDEESASRDEIRDVNWPRYSFDVARS